MDEQNNVTGPEGMNAEEAAAQEAVPAAETAPVAQPEVAPTQSEAQPASVTTVQPTQEMPAPQGQPVAQTAAMPTQPAAPQPGVMPTMPQPGAMGNGAAGAYPPPKPTGALVCGILSIVLAGVVGLILGIIAVVQSNKYFKAGGTEGAGKAGKICGIIGIVVSAIAIVAICAATVFGLAALNDEINSSSSLTSTPSSTFQSSSSTSSALSDASPEDEAAVYEVVDAELDKIKNLDPAMVASIAAFIEESLNDALATQDITLADLQVDPTALTTAMLEGFEYEHYYVDASGDEAEANYHVTCKDMYSVMNEFYDQLMEMMDEDLSQYDSEEAAYVAIGQALMSSVEATAPSEDELFDVDLNKVGGNWVIDQDSWDDEMDYFFGA